MTSTLTKTPPAFRPGQKVGLGNLSSSEPSLMYIDVRTPQEFQIVHIPGSRNIPLSELSQHLDELRQLSRQNPLTVLCRTQNRAQTALEYLRDQGITNCGLLEGGITQWIYQENPLLRSPTSISPEGQVRAVAGSLILLGAGLTFLFSPWFLFLPVLVGIGLIHAGLTDSCLMGKLISSLPMNRPSSSTTAHRKEGNHELSTL